MHRVVCSYEGRNWQRIVERGPWLPTRHEAESWAEALRQAGYITTVEARDTGPIGGGSSGGGGNDDLMAALSSMA